MKYRVALLIAVMTCGFLAAAVRTVVQQWNFDQEGEGFASLKGDVAGQSFPAIFGDTDCVAFDGGYTSAVDDGNSYVNVSFPNSIMFTDLTVESARLTWTIAKWDFTGGSGGNYQVRLQDDASNALAVFGFRHDTLLDNVEVFHTVDQLSGTRTFERLSKSGTNYMIGIDLVYSNDTYRVWSGTDSHVLQTGTITDLGSGNCDAAQFRFVDMSVNSSNTVVYDQISLTYEPWPVSSNVFYVATDGNDSNTGSFAAPFATIQYAYDQVHPGDTIVLRGGTFREAISLVKKSGYEDGPITLMAYSNETPVISGLDVYDSLVWSNCASGIYVASYTNEAFEQFFFNGKPMLEARWPNVPTDGSGGWDFFSSNVWAAVDSSGNSYGTIKDSDLAATGWDATGSRVVLNVSHQFSCWTRIVSNHTAGSSIFNYPTNLSLSETHQADYYFQDDCYYLVGKLDYLDAPGEWYLDTANSLLYFYPPDGLDPNQVPVEVKTRPFSFRADQNSSHLIIDGITFQGTAFKFGDDQYNRSSGIVFRNNSVLYSSWTDDFNPFVALSQNDDDSDEMYPACYSDNALFSNNLFDYGALSAINVVGIDCLIENNVFRNFDYCSSLKYPPLLLGSGETSCSCSNMVCRNTLYNSGGILLMTKGERHEVCENHLYNMFLSCWGGNHDHAALYTHSTYCKGTRFWHNWVHDGYAGSPATWGAGLGIRGDDETAGLTVDHNVTWNLGSAGILIKNIENPSADDANACCNNTIFNHSQLLDISSALIIRTVETNENSLTPVCNNMAETIYGNWRGVSLGSVGSLYSNSLGMASESLLVSTNWFDFRPSVDAVGIIDGGVVVSGLTDNVVGAAPDIGAYELGSSVYWIPGQRIDKASFPIVPDGATGVPSSRDILMWRPAREAVEHHVYFGTAPGNLAYQDTFGGETNVFTLPSLTAGGTYYWRVDAEMSDASVVTGNVWTFEVSTMQ